MTSYAGSLEKFVNSTEDRGIKVVKCKDTDFGHKAILLERSILGKDSIFMTYRVFKKPVSPQLVDEFVVDLKKFIKKFYVKYEPKAQFHHSGYRPEDDVAIREKWSQVHEKILDLLDLMEEFFPEWNGSESKGPTVGRGVGQEVILEKEEPLNDPESISSLDDMEKILDEEPVKPGKK
ncbi:MAG: hypothetical protein ABH950_05030 [Candidatus Altiarchaeota archaeon]